MKEYIKIKNRAIQVLGYYGDEKAIKPICKCLHDNLETLKTAMSTFKKFESKKILDTIQPVLYHLTMTDYYSTYSNVFDFLEDTFDISILVKGLSTFLLKCIS